MSKSRSPEPIVHPENVPGHIGIIMDGNGRWAQQRGMKRTAGHKEGLHAAKRVVKAAKDIGVRFLSLYTFSTENWRRTQEEVSFLMNLVGSNLKRELDFYRENEIRVMHTGDRTRLPGSVLREIDDVVEQTAHHRGLTVNLAINYGGRDEITRALFRILERLESIAIGTHHDSDEGVPNDSGPPTRDIGDPASDSSSRLEALTGEIETIRSRIAESGFSVFLDQPDLPEADLIIRSGGEYRLSNFLLWQSAYSELFFDETLWPDWNADCLYRAIRAYESRSRRYGGIS